MSRGTVVAFPVLFVALVVGVFMLASDAYGAQPHHLPEAMRSASSVFPVVYRGAERCTPTVAIARPGRPMYNPRADGEWWGELCEVRLTARWRSLPPARICDIATHELGHGSGRGHSRDPKDVMYSDDERGFDNGVMPANCQWMVDRPQAERNRIAYWTKRQKVAAEARDTWRDELRDCRPRRARPCRKLKRRVRRLSAKVGRIDAQRRAAEVRLAWWA